jgi:hypothetical protein
MLPHGHACRTAAAGRLERLDSHSCCDASSKTPLARASCYDARVRGGAVFGTVLLGSILGSACSQSVEVGCRQDDECVLSGTPGICQPDGYCSYPDPTCPSGLSYPVTTGSGLGGTCVPGSGGDGASGSVEPSTATATAASGDETSTTGLFDGSTGDEMETTGSESITSGTSGTSGASESSSSTSDSSSDGDSTDDTSSTGTSA